MKIYMHWDMEGVSGLFTREQVWYWEAGVRSHVARQGLELITADAADTAARAALEAGADKAVRQTGARRVDDDTVEARVDRQCDVVKWINGTGLP